MDDGAGDVRDVWLGDREADKDLPGIHSRSRVGSSRETKRWILKSWRR